MNFYTIRPTKQRSAKRKVTAILLPNTLVGIAVGLLVIGVGISYHAWRVNGAANHQAYKLVYAANHNLNHTVPSTIKPPVSTFTSYTVAANLPRYIFIPKLSVKAVVRPIYLTPTHQLGTPDNVYDTGWYTRSATPGQPGAMVIDGHVSSWTTNGVFYGLRTLQPGDVIQIERGDGTIVNYSVVKRQVYTYQQVNMSALLSPIDANKPGLNLITCTGDVIQGTNDFNERVVVFAVET